MWTQKEKCHHPRSCVKAASPGCVMVASLMRAIIVCCLAALNSGHKEPERAKDDGPELAGLHHVTGIASRLFYGS